jgi:hypothetical protein
MLSRLLVINIIIINVAIDINSGRLNILYFFKNGMKWYDNIFLFYFMVNDKEVIFIF